MGAATPPPPLAGPVPIYAKTTVDCSPDSYMAIRYVCKQFKYCAGISEQSMGGLEPSWNRFVITGRSDYI
jgi:hypothetical protein